jgi:hypothetical protein
MPFATLRLAGLAAALLAAPVAAQTPPPASGPWRPAGERLELPAAKLSLPMRAGGMALVRSGESSRQGSGLDAVAQYQTEDRSLFATVYVYRTTYPDAALAAHATDRVIRAVFRGAETAERGSAALDGRAGTAIRSVYRKGSYNGQSMTTAAAVARVGDWLVKMRVTGPEPRDGEVLAAVDALLAGVKVDAGVTVPAASPLQFDAPCPPADRQDAKAVTGQEAQANAMLGSLAGLVPARSGATPRFPTNGTQRACVVGTLGAGPVAMEVIRAAGGGAGDPMVVALNDSGSVMSIQPSMTGRSQVVMTYVVGAVEVRGTLDRQPTPEQLARWMQSGDDALRLRSRGVVGPDGKTTVEVNSDAVR